LQDGERTRTAQGANLGPRAQRDVQGKAALVLGADAMQDNRTPARLAPGTFSPTTPRFPDGQGELAIASACHLD
jgi:hypothetical protein